MPDPTGADQTLARKKNSSLILNMLRLDGPLSRADLAKRIGLTRSSISRIVENLAAEKLVREVELSAGKKGRPGMLLELDSQGGSAIGIEIGVHFISILLTDFTARLLWSDRVTMPAGAGPEAYLQKANQLAHQAAAVSQDRGLRLMGIGIGVWGLVDHEKGTIRYAPNLKWKNIPVKETFETDFGVPVYLENDSNASALGEYYFGDSRKVENFIYLSMDIGIGGGILSEGRLFRGASGYAGEIGHMLIDPAGELCSCGKIGCLETLVGRNVILRKYRERKGGSESVTLERVIELGRLGDAAALAVFEQAADALGRGIGNLVNLFNPQRIILGWSLGQACDLLQPTLLESLRRNCLPDPLEKLEIVPFTNGADDCMLGCVALVLDEIIREQVTI
jgi:predicted NBD/HSP70 family sugar kinase